MSSTVATRTTGAGLGSVSAIGTLVTVFGIIAGQSVAELPKDDPNRQVVMTGSFLRASLFTSVVAFGVAFMGFGLGIVLTLVGVAPRRVARA